MTLSAISYPTGAMINNVAANAMPLIAMLGGTCCTPMAFRVIISTITIFKNDVQMTNNRGISDSAPRKSARTRGSNP